MHWEQLCYPIPHFQYLVLLDRECQNDSRIVFCFALSHLGQLQIDLGKSESLSEGLCFNFSKQCKALFVLYNNFLDLCFY